MIEWLGDTLKAIILIILFAAVIDLIVPGKTMQRYVKVVVSLFILMTILNPVLGLLNMEWDPGQLELEPHPMLEPTLAEYTPLAEIWKEGHEIREQQEQRSLDQVQNRIVRTMTDDLERLTGRKMEQVAVELITEEGTARIRTVSIVIADEREIGLPDAVRPIDIEIGQSLNEPVDVKKDDSDMSAANDEQVAEMVSYLQSTWQLSGDQIIIRRASGRDRGDSDG